MHSSHRHEFLSTEHLGTEAIAAFVDGELSPTALRRAKAHLLACPECRREVARQRQASRRLRDSSEIHIPADLRARLASLSESVCEERDAAGMAYGTGTGERGFANEREDVPRRPQTFKEAMQHLMRNVRKGGVG